MRAWVLAFLGTLAAAPTAEGCSKVRFSAFRAPGSEAVIAISTRDTIAAPRSGALPPVFGMIARVEKLGTATRIATSATVVLVPWGYGADCKPEPWLGSVLWVPPGTRGLYIGKLRDKSEWIGGRPTIDVHNAYRGGFPYTESHPSAEDMLAVYDRLPEPPRVRSDTARLITSFAPLFKWARDNPNVARTPLVAGLVREARWSIGQARIENIDSPVAGTYRFVVGVAGGDAVTFFATSERHPISTLRETQRHAPQSYDADEVPISVGYFLYTEVGVSAEAAKRPASNERERTRRGGYIAALIEPKVVNTDSTVWQGSVDLFDAAASLFDASTRAALKGFSDYQEKEESYVPGRFVTRRGGRTTYEASYKLPGRPTLFVRGVRISTDVLPTRR